MFVPEYAEMFACCRVGGAGTNWLMVPFVHVSDDRPSRFSRGRFGVLYAGRKFETARLETVHHHARFMARTKEPAEWTSQFREIVLDIDGRLHDLRGQKPGFAAALDPNDHSEAQALSEQLRSGASEGLVYPNVRNPGGECVGLFFPGLASNPWQGRRQPRWGFETFPATENRREVLRIALWIGYRPGQAHYGLAPS